MAGETTITVIGNLTADPELKYSPNGSAVANFTVASTPRTFDRQSNEWKDGETLFLRPRSGVKRPRTSPNPSPRVCASSSQAG
ncbi:single-stranded DNA-binding protein (plasmid) [Arthrobacter sp. Hiyo8]|nr:single-stranded DNA-binding protein [Arthrobacter sp. Hiyo8]